MAVSPGSWTGFPLFPWPLWWLLRRSRWYTVKKTEFVIEQSTFSTWKGRHHPTRSLSCLHSSQALYYFLNSLEQSLFLFQVIDRSFGVVFYKRRSQYAFAIRKHPAGWPDVIPALLRWRQNWFKASLGYIRPVLKERREGREGGIEGWKPPAR